MKFLGSLSNYNISVIRFVYIFTFRLHEMVVDFLRCVLLVFFLRGRNNYQKRDKRGSKVFKDMESCFGVRVVEMIAV
jgi:hypothetical protein